ncbi:MAG TPA: hypothetical protein VJI46_02600 [Candidatus Nanoarchaeia archaeon]|nr:hypothetical protein [Candidatus Nanoarchaeia archaeon]
MKSENKFLIATVGSSLLAVAATVGIIVVAAGRYAESNYIKPTYLKQDKPSAMRDISIAIGHTSIRYYKNPFIVVYDRYTNQVDRNSLEEIDVDRGGDGHIDEVLRFYRKGESLLSSNSIGIYQGSLAGIANEEELIPLPENLPTSEDYRSAAKTALEGRGYPGEMIDGFDFNP